MAKRDTINLRLRGLDNSAPFSQLAVGQENLRDAFADQKSNLLAGQPLGAIIDGILKGINTTDNPKAAIGILTGKNRNIPIEVNNSDADALRLITGAQAGHEAVFKELIFTAATKEGLSASIPDFLTGDDGLPSLANLTERFKASIANSIQTLTGNALQDLILADDRTPITILQRLGISSASKAGLILSLIQNDDLTRALEVIRSETGGDNSQIEVALEQLKGGTLSSQIDPPTALPSSGVETFDATAKGNEWRGRNTGEDYFDVIPTEQQLRIELLATSREITEIIFYGHEMTEDQVLTAPDIHQAYRDSGGIPFHFVILINGNLQRGRPLNLEGDYSEAHRRYSIGIAIPYVRGGRSTVAQGKAVDQIISTFRGVWPGGRVFDAAFDLSESEVALPLDVQGYLIKHHAVNFGGREQSLSTADLIEAAIRS